MPRALVANLSRPHPSESERPQTFFGSVDGALHRHLCLTEQRRLSALAPCATTISEQALLVAHIKEIETWFALRVATRFAAPHTVLEFTESGKAAFLGYQTLLNVRSNAAVKALRGACAVDMFIYSFELFSPFWNPRTSYWARAARRWVAMI